LAQAARAADDAAKRGSGRGADVGRALVGFLTTPRPSAPTAAASTAVPVQRNEVNSQEHLQQHQATAGCESHAMVDPVVVSLAHECTSFSLIPILLHVLPRPAAMQCVMHHH
jgi:hypothetical protein